MPDPAVRANDRRVGHDNKTDGMNRHIYRFIAAVLAAITIVSCNDARKSGTYRLLEDVDSYIEARPDSALAVLESIDKSGLATEALEAYYDLTKWYLLVKTTGSIPGYETIQDAYDYYTSRKPSNERFQARLYKGICFINGGDYENAMIEFSKADEDYEYATLKNQAQLHGYKGYIHKRLFDYPSSISEITLAAEKYQEADLMQKYFASITDIMDSHIMNNDIDAAAEYLEIAEQNLKYCTTTGFHDFQITKAKIISRKYGHEACADMLDDYLSNVTDERDVISWRIIAYMYNNAGRYDKALECIEKEAEYNDVSNDQNYYFVLAEIKKSLENYKGSAESYDKSLEIDGSTETGRFHTNARLIEELHKNKTNQIKANFKSNIITVSILILLFIAGIVILFIKKQLLQKTAENMELEIERLKYEKMYSDALAEREILNDIVEKSSVREKTRQVISDRLEVLNKVIISHITDTSRDNRKAYEELEALISDRASFLESTKKTIENINPDFVSYLVSKGLTESEVNLCCLYAIGMKGKDIKDYTATASVYKDSSVIRQKLGLMENDTNLSNFLQDLLKMPSGKLL